MTKTKHPIGRPRNAAPELPIYDSMKGTAGATGIPAHVLASAKAAGCPAFRAGRVYLGEFLAWYFNTGSDGEALRDWRDEKLKFEAKLAEQEFQTKAGTLVEFEEALAITREVLLPIRQCWLALPNTLASKCNPTDPEHARAALEEWVYSAMKLVADGERAKLPKIKK